jgi:hypothetical protein
MDRHQGRRRSAGGQYYRAHRLAELDRGKTRRACFASAAHSFVEVHPEYAAQWHPIYDPVRHVYRLTRKEESNWRAFLREHGWEVGEKGREGRIARSNSPTQKVGHSPARK